MVRTKGKREGRSRKNKEGGGGTEKNNRERKKSRGTKKISEVWSDIGEIPQSPEKTFNFLKKNYSLKEI